MMVELILLICQFKRYISLQLIYLILHSLIYAHPHSKTAHPIASIFLTLCFFIKFLLFLVNVVYPFNEEWSLE